MVNWECKAWNELSRDEWHAIAKLRQDVFVVEQECAYPDLDGLDEQAAHLTGHSDGALVAYARLFGPGVSHEQRSIGRVIVVESARGHGLGYSLMRIAADETLIRWGPGVVHLSAQTHLAPFYERLGYSVVGAGYLEDGIPHVPMEQTLEAT